MITGGYPGDQAEYCRVPNADLTCVTAPKNIDAKKLVGLADVTPTAWHGCELAEVGEGDVVGVWGCGAVGLSIQRLAKFRGAHKVYAIDKDASRLKTAESFGMIPINVDKHRIRQITFYRLNRTAWIAVSKRAVSGVRTRPLTRP